MRVVVNPAARDGCGYWRMIYPAETLQAQGHDVTVEYDSLRGTWVDQGGVPRCLTVDIEADVVVLQRPFRREVVEAIPVMQAQGTRVVVEIDDDFHALPRENHAWAAAQREWLTREEAITWFREHNYPPSLIKKCRSMVHHHPKGHREVRWVRVPEAVSARHKGHLMAACKRADLVTCTTQALAERYGKHGRVAVLPNCVPESWLSIDAPANDPLRVGWTGWVGTHPGDLDVCGAGIAEACDTHGAIFRGIGDHTAANLLGVRNRESTGWVSLERYPYQTAQLDVGIVPLAATPFNEAKSWLKGLEYAALGVPFVASPSSPYRRLHAEGAGVLAHGHVQWAEKVGLLLENERLRNELAEQGRETARRWTLEANAWRWLEAWESTTTRKVAA